MGFKPKATKFDGVDFPSVLDARTGVFMKALGFTLHQRDDWIWAERSDVVVGFSACYYGYYWNETKCEVIDKFMAVHQGRQIFFVSGFDILEYIEGPYGAGFSTTSKIHLSRNVIGWCRDHGAIHYTDALRIAKKAKFQEARDATTP